VAPGARRLTARPPEASISPVRVVASLHLLRRAGAARIPTQAKRGIMGMAGLFGFLRRDAGNPARTDRQRTGRRGERVAERFLKRHGCRILARNVTYRQGEVDLVALEKDTRTVVFVEVRSRRLAENEDAVVEPEETVTRAKRRRVASAATTFLADRHATGRAVRFDVITVRFAADGRGKPDVRHYPGAFDVRGNLLS